MTSGEEKIGLRAGDVLAREKARRLATRNMHASKEAVEATGIESMLREIEALGVPDDAPAEVEAVPRHIDKVPPFLLDGVHPQVQEAYGQVREWTRCILSKACAPHSLSLLGNSGCGKTHLAKLCRAHLLDKGVSAQMWSWARVLAAHREDQGDFLRQIDKVRVLILDDVGAEFLGTQRATEFSLAKLCEMLDAREGRWTLVTSNMLLKDVASLDERCASRLLRNGGRLVTLDEAKDWALEHYMKNKTH